MYIYICIYIYVYIYIYIYIYKHKYITKAKYIIHCQLRNKIQNMIQFQETKITKLLLIKYVQLLLLLLTLLKH